MAISPNAPNEKGGMKMTGSSDVIVYLWFLPVVLYIVVPLTMLCCWLLGRLIFPQKYRRQAAVNREEVAITPKIPAKA